MEVYSSSDIYFAITDNEGLYVNDDAEGIIGAMTGLYMVSGVKYQDDHINPEDDLKLVEIISTSQGINLYENSIKKTYVLVKEATYSTFLSSGPKKLFLGADIDGTNVKSIVVSCLNDQNECEVEEESSKSSESSEVESSTSEADSINESCSSVLGDVLNLQGSIENPIPVYDSNQVKIIPCSSLDFEFTFEVEKTSDIYFTITNSNGLMKDVAMKGQIGIISGDYSLGEDVFEFDYIDPSGDTTEIKIKSSSNELSMYRDNILVGSLAPEDYKYPSFISIGAKQLYFAADYDGTYIRNIILTCLNGSGE
ncbi:hypothetical protein AYI69_g5404, partial [Smittium culicis]